MVNDKELDEFIQGDLKNDLKKDITQEDKIDESVEAHLGEMGFLWDRVQEKMKKDSICFSCKHKINFDNKEQVRIVEATKVEEGVVAFVSICNKCFDEQIKEKGEEKNE